jgi:hypothetical protein
LQAVFFAGEFISAAGKFGFGLLANLQRCVVWF